MNGIIHNCTHKDSGDVQFQLTEKEMFIAIFNYIEHLYGKIKPKKLFFMAIDGVAPRAKMNQQRARRFRTALDNERAREKAIKEGKPLPPGDPFDSNCITPGTEFMAKLSQQLKYFINKKVSEDKEWQGPEIVLSGHEVPGEGEHKIMEYIRNARAQSNYDPNVRHCLYGLDADLIMLGLLSHDPHFCLLREEVTFGPQKSKTPTLEHQKFYLMHLCIVREYLELEFQDLKKEGAMDFPFDMERVIDDFILMAFFVGNDFLPNLPHLHINEGALATMFRIYKEVLPRCGGYVNENGKVNLQRLGLLLEQLSKMEYRFFEHENEDKKWIQSKRTLEKEEQEAQKAEKAKSVASQKGKLTMTSEQRALWKGSIRKFLMNRSSSTLDLGTGLKAAEREWVQNLADVAHIEWTTKEDEEGNRHLILSIPAMSDEDDEEAHSAVIRIVKRYDNANVVDISSAEARAKVEARYQEEFRKWKDDYYFNKFEDWTKESYQEELRKLAENYIQGIQWVLYYYYRGIASWPWFYGYHYSPMISDVMKGINADLNFKLGQPFRPNEQLMGVLPDRSKKIVPQVYWPLMTDPDSPIIDFYPRDFELDMNGKKMDWEAVVKIPFIDEKRLLEAMKPKNQLLTDDEKARNDFGVALKFTYSEDVDYVYPSSMVDVFPEIPHCHCVMNIFELPPTEGLEFREGLTDGALLNVSALAGFPTLATLPYTAQLDFAQVEVFQQASRNESMIVTILDAEVRARVESAKAKLGQRCFVGYPFLQEAKVVRVSDELFDYTLATDGSGQVVATPHSNSDISTWQRTAERLETRYRKKLGIVIGDMQSLVHVEMLRGLTKMDDGSTVKEYGDIPQVDRDVPPQTFPTQTIVDEVVNEDERFIERAALPLEEEFPIKSAGFFLGDFHYGRPAEVTGYNNGKLVLALSTLEKREPEFTHRIIREAEKADNYIPSYMVSKQLELQPLTLSKITSAYFVRTTGDLRQNLGLNLKFEGRQQKVLGYSRKSRSGWEFSKAAMLLIIEYMTKFPDFFAAVKRNPAGAELSETDLWPDKDKEQASARVKEIVAWIKTLKISQLERVPLDAEQLDSTVVTQLAEEADRLKLNEMPQKPQKLNGVPRHALLRPQDAANRLANQQFAVGDRVVYVAQTGKVPIAFRGTVVGISQRPTEKLVDVVFDTTFLSGTTLGERCPPFRGQTVPSSAILNLTNRQLVAESKAAQARQPAYPAAGVPAGRPGVTMSNGRPYRDAQAPSPGQSPWRGGSPGGRGGRGRGGGPQAQAGHGSQNPQHGSMAYRPAPHQSVPQTGQAQATRGSLNLMHSSVVYGPPSHQSGPQTGQAPAAGHVSGHTRGGSRGNGRGRGGSSPVGNASVGQQSSPAPYGAVPPPSNLDSPRGGRGRGGRGRGRGEGRGRGMPRGGQGGVAPQQAAAQN
ncbi:hypothetical protein QBC47DRAFT_14455 [Echria macrotheca]|uniref:5'-3' exoribonuclease 1 n=1 Tax=Echria macrotheca TaxID=438768 RepID=A0AAJ0BRR4_9PEZI|nr:hypothetical protein QBC47DRAFT_14455 [Echria macrotheca]